MTEREAKTPWVTPSRRKAEEWKLVLTAAGIPSTIEKRPVGWALVYAWSDEDRVARELTGFQEEQAQVEAAAASGATYVEYGRTYAGILIAACFLGFYLVTGPRNPAVIWFREGSASAAAIMAGETWRTITALTLHADPPHVLGNAASCAVFVTAVCRQLGPGVGSCLVILAGAIGNAINAFAHGAHHTSVGASTALFGAIGIMVGLQVATRRRRLIRRSRPWVPVAAGLALLAMLGTGRNADIAAHFFGFAAGIPLGMAAALVTRRPARGAVQCSLSFAGAAAVIGSWVLALG